jgi:hypothetical protein
MVFFYGGSDGAVHRCAPPSYIIIRTDHDMTSDVGESQPLLLIHSSNMAASDTGSAMAGVMMFCVHYDA